MDGWHSCCWRKVLLVQDFRLQGLKPNEPPGLFSRLKNASENSPTLAKTRKDGPPDFKGKSAASRELQSRGDGSGVAAVRQTASRGELAGHIVTRDGGGGRRGQRKKGLTYSYMGM
jgi:hypothetical protein